MRTVKSHHEIRQHIHGPVPSLRPPFLRDGAIDFKGLRTIVDFCVEAGASSLLLTFGDSLFSLLTDDEVAEVTRVVNKQAAGRALVIAADRVWWTGKTVAFAQFAREAGADVLMVLPPDWGHSATPRTFADHYITVAEHIPVMMVTNVFIPRGTGVAFDTIDILLREAPNVVAVKDDWCGDFARRLCLKVADQWVVLSGGQKANHFDAWLYGCQSYLSSFMSYQPRVTQKYWNAIARRDIEAAREVIATYDNPFFDHILACTGGFDAAMHGMLELYGLAGRWRRTPYHSMTDAELEQLKGFLQSKDLL